MAVIAFSACVFGFDRPRIMGFLPCLAALVLIVFIFGLAACPKVPLRPRLRIAGMILPALFLSIDCTHWPLFASFMMCKPWANIIADQVRANGPTPWSQGGMLRVRRGRVLPNGTVGFHLIGDDGGGIYLVRRAGPLSADRPDRVWYNTNWETNMGGQWYIVDED